MHDDVVRLFLFCCLFVFVKRQRSPPSSRLIVVWIEQRIAAEPPGVVWHGIVARVCTTVLCEGFWHSRGLYTTVYPVSELACSPSSGLSPSDTLLGMTTQPAAFSDTPPLPKRVFIITFRQRNHDGTHPTEIVERDHLTFQPNMAIFYNCLPSTREPTDQHTDRHTEVLAINIDLLERIEDITQPPAPATRTSDGKEFPQ